MPTPATLDIERFLTPLERPEEDSERTPSYSALKAARQQAANEEKRNLDDPDAGADPAALDGHWRNVRELAERVLTEEAKDLGASAYLMEALLRSDGFAGLRDAFRLTRQLVENFWDQICPLPADQANRSEEASEEEQARWRQERLEQVSNQLGLLASLNGRGRDGSLIPPLRTQPLTEQKDNGVIALADYLNADLLSKGSSDTSRQRGATLRAEIERAVTASSDKFLISLRDDVQECLDEFRKLATTLQDRSGLGSAQFSLAFPSSTIENALQECLTIAQRNAEGRAPATTNGESQSSASPLDIAAQRGQITPGGGGLTREGALRTLEGLAHFFEQTDPHSPLAPALRQIVRWARTPIGDLYAELIPDEEARKSLFKLIGVKLQQNEDQS